MNPNQGFKLSRLFSVEISKKLNMQRDRENQDYVTFPTHIPTMS